LGLFGVGYGVIGPQAFALQEDQIENACDPPVSPRAIGVAKNLTQAIWWPGCQTSNLINNMEDFQAMTEDMLVSYPSRQQDGHETVTLSGWLLKPKASHFPAGTIQPRIVVQHGYTSNANKYRPMVAAYMLRSLGYVVISNNLRDRCGSGNSTYRKVGWGYDYPYDVLGAWDYARLDPDNLFGGPLPSGQVGIWGCSMGAFATNTAFGLESRISGVFLDSPPINALGGVYKSVVEKVGSTLAGILLPGTWAPAWRGAVQYASVDVDLHEPTKDLPKGPDTRRKIGIVGNTRDNTIAYYNIKDLVALVKGPLNAKYSISEEMIIDATCNQTTHVIAHLSQPNAYRRLLCNFFSNAFMHSADFCRLSTLPNLD
jgi:hypothetical protein